MKSGKLYLTHNFEGETQYIILRWFKTTDPLTPQAGLVTGTGLGPQDGTNVTQVYYPAPQEERTLIIEDLDPVLFIVKAYRSADGITPDTYLSSITGDASTKAAYGLVCHTYVVGRGQTGDPNDGDTGLRDSRLLDAEYTVEERGTGMLIPPGELGAEYIDRSDDGGGFDFTTDGKVFNEGGVYFVCVQSKTDVTGEESSSGSGSDEITDVYMLQKDEGFDRNAMNGRLIYADKNAPEELLTLTFENLALIADCFFRVSTQSCGQRYLVLQLDIGDTVRHQGEDKNAIYLGKGEHIGIMIRNGVMFIVSEDTNYHRVGQRIYGEKKELNTEYLDGSEAYQADYPRLMEFLDSLPPGQVVNYATWDTLQVVNIDGYDYNYYPNKGLWARDDSTGTFRFPDERNFYRKALSSVTGAADTTRLTANSKPGGQQAKQGLRHTHGLPNDAAGSSNIPTLTNTSGSDEGMDETQRTGVSGSTRMDVDNIGFLPLVVI